MGERKGIGRMKNDDTCEQCKYFEHVERLVYYCHRFGLYLDLTEATGCRSFKKKDEVNE